MGDLEKNTNSWRAHLQPLKYSYPQCHLKVPDASDAFWVLWLESVTWDPELQIPETDPHPQPLWKQLPFPTSNLA